MENQFHKKTYLPESYVLSDYDVICGRGRNCFFHEGNIRFRQLVETQLERYIETKMKTDKTVIIYEIIDYIRKSNPAPGAGFVKLDKTSGKYYEVGDFVAREKTSQAFRDLLHEKYKSSNANKRLLRKVLTTNIDNSNQDSPNSNRSKDGNPKISATVSGGLSKMSPDVQNVLSISTKSLVEECNNFLTYPSIEPLTSIFDTDSTRHEQMNATQQQVPSSMNFNQNLQNLRKDDFNVTQPNESIESQDVWWDQKCGIKANSFPNIYDANSFDIASLTKNQSDPLVTPCLLRNKIYSQTSMTCLPPIDKSTIRFDESYNALTITNFPQTQHFSNDNKTDIDYHQRNIHEIDYNNSNEDDLHRNDFNLYKM